VNDHYYDKSLCAQSVGWRFAKGIGYNQPMEVSMEVYPGITMDPEVRFGKPCIKATRVDVATVLGRFAAGDKIEDIQEDYQLTRDQVMAALAYATHVAEHLPPAVKSA
jgi:uncharacterized protein (DUF433 family)